MTKKNKMEDRFDEKFGYSYSLFNGNEFNITEEIKKFINQEIKRAEGIAFEKGWQSGYTQGKEAGLDI